MAYDQWSDHMGIHEEWSDCMMASAGAYDAFDHTDTWCPWPVTILHGIPWQMTWWLVSDHMTFDSPCKMTRSQHTRPMTINTVTKKANCTQGFLLLESQTLPHSLQIKCLPSICPSTPGVCRHHLGRWQDGRNSAECSTLHSQGPEHLAS